MSREAPRTLELFPARWMLALYSAIGVFFLVMGGGAPFGLLEKMRERPPSAVEAVTVSVLFLLAGGAFVYVFLPPLLHRRPSIVADPAGLHDRRRVFSFGSLAWPEVKAVGYVRRGKSAAFAIWLVDDEPFIANRPGWLRPLLRWRRKRGAPVAQCLVLAMPDDIDDFAKRLARLYPVRHVRR